MSFKLIRGRLLKFFMSLLLTNLDTRRNRLSGTFLLPFSLHWQFYADIPYSLLKMMFVSLHLRWVWSMKPSE